MPTFSAATADYTFDDLGALAGGQNWQLDQDRAALLVHDLLPYYLQVLGPATAAAVIAGTEQALRWAYHHNVPILTSAPRPARTLAQRGLGGTIWGLGPTPEQAAERALPDLHETTTIHKRSLSAFYSTDLDTELRRLRRDQLVLSGVFASAGVLVTAFDALARDTEVITVADAVADYTRDRHVHALSLLRDLGRVLTTTDLVDL